MSNGGALLFDRDAELEELDFVLSEAGSHFLLVAGRRRSPVCPFLPYKQLFLLV